MKMLRLLLVPKVRPPQQFSPSGYSSVYCVVSLLAFCFLTDGNLHVVWKANQLCCMINKLVI